MTASRQLTTARIYGATRGVAPAQARFLFSFLQPRSHASRIAHLPLKTKPETPSIT
jgi:hypothetical protein